MQPAGQHPAKAAALLLFIIAALADIAGILLKTDWLQLAAKPLLLPLLIVAAAVATPASAPFKLLFITALFFSWAGDLFLLFESSHALFFIFGLASFLTTHMLYILYFIKTGKGNRKSLLKQQGWLVPLVLLYGAGLVIVLFPSLRSLKIPVIIYATVICTMLLCSLHIFNRLPRAVALLFSSGALLFVLSDSLLAVNKFYTVLPFGGPLVMLTYCGAQFNIVKGFIKRNNHDQNSAAG